MNPDTLAKTEEIQAKLVAKAWADDAFHAALLKSPKETVKNFLIAEGYPVPPNIDQINIQVIEADPSNIVLVIPARPEDTKLSDEELDAVAGGSDCSDYACW